MVLIKLARNRLYEAIAQSGLDPSQCELENTEDRLVITHNSGSTYVATKMASRLGYLFIFRRVRFMVEAYTKDGLYRTYKTKFSSSGLLPSLQKWANDVKQTTEAPDYWEDLKRNREFITDVRGEDSGNAPFAQDEQNQIAAQLQVIKEFVAEKFELSSEQMTLIEEKLDEAAEASSRMGRKDWLLLFSGTIFTVIVTDIVTPGVAEHIFTMVINSLGHLFTGGSESPQIPPQILA